MIQEKYKQNVVTMAFGSLGNFRKKPSVSYCHQKIEEVARLPSQK